MESLRGKKDFERVFSEGQRAQNACMTMLAVPREAVVVRIGLPVGKRFGKAVRRNRIRRRLREACRIELMEAQLATGWDIVCIPRSRVHDMDFAVLREAVRELFSQQGIIGRQQADEVAG